MYRAVAWKVLSEGKSPKDGLASSQAARSSKIRVRPSVVTVDGVDVTEEIRGEDVTEAASAVAANPEVRAELLARQRRWARYRNGCVMEGRDIATVVLPNADLKVFLDADPEVRARRRAGESSSEPSGVQARMSQRDSIDSSREHAPLRRTEDSLQIDTSNLSVEEVTRKILSKLGKTGIRAHRKGGKGGIRRFNRQFAPSRFGERGTAWGILLHWTVRTIIKVVAVTYLRMRRRNVERVPRKGALIIVPGGHRSNLDTPLVGAAVPRRMYYMAKDSLFKTSFWARLITLVGGFPTQRDRVDVNALKYARKVLGRGDALVIFAEGERKSGPRIQPLFGGTVWLSEKTGAPILPVGVGGTEKAMPKGVRLPRPHRVRFVFGELIPAMEGSSSRLSAVRRRTQATEDLREIIQRLFDEAQALAGSPNE